MNDRPIAAEPVWTGDLLASPHEVADKAGRVRRMFNAIAPRYELVNSLFSAGRDAFWRRRAVAWAGVRPDDEVLDVACGTGDFARAFSAAGPRRVVGCDFAHEMLRRARGATGGGLNGPPVCRFCEADASRLPFASGSFSVVSCAFGVRNFELLEVGLQEMYRVLRPGGRVVILEFARPTHRLGAWLYGLYSRKVMPIAASWLSGDRSGAYHYLPRSVATFPDGLMFCEKMAQAGFVSCKARPLTFGVVMVYVGRRE